MTTPPWIHKKDVILVKPAEYTPSEVLSLSTLDNDPFLEFHYQTIHVYKGNNINNLDPTLVIKEALSKVLVYYYPLAGKLKRQKDRKLRITCNADGVPFLEANAYCELSSLHYLEGIDIETAKMLSFDWPSESEFGYHPLLLSLTKFSCGGFTIGLSLSHSVCDGYGASRLYRAMAELASGKSEPTVKPVWERERLVGTASKDPIFPKDMSSLANSPFLPCTFVAHESFYVSGETIERLKMSLLRELKKTDKENFTTVEILGAYVWRSRTRALQLVSEGNTVFSMDMGIRNVLNPPLNAGYYGNAVAYSSDLVLAVSDLDEFPLSKVAKLIKESKKVLTSSSDFVPKMLDKEETILQQNIEDEISKCTSPFELTDWRHLGFLESVDFGWKEMVNFVPLPLNNFYIDLCMLLPPCKVDSSMKGKGGVRVLVTLPQAAMAKMREEMECLNQLGGEHIDMQSKP